MRIKNMIKGAVAWAALCTIALSGACGDVDAPAEKPRVGTVVQALGGSCTTNQDCTGDYHGEPHVCRDGSCVLGCDEATDCPFLHDECDYTNGWCVDTQGDPENCGTVGNSCASHQTCELGSCVIDWQPPGEPCVEPPSGSANLNCGPDYAGWCTDIDGGGFICVDIENDEKHCGAGNIECREGEICEHGKCALGVGMECDPSATYDDYDEERGDAVHCYTGMAGDLSSPAYHSPVMLQTYQLDTEKRLECCAVGQGFECVNILDSENCGECGGEDCAGGEGPNESCTVDPDDPAAPPFCACTWNDPHSGEGQFKICNTLLADSCLDGTGGEAKIGCGCGTGPESYNISGMSCSSGDVVGCTENEHCPYGQVCDTSGSTGVCKVVGCDENSDCTTTGNSEGVAFFDDTNVPKVDESGTINGGMRCTSNPGGTGELNTTSVTSPPSGWDGICVDISSDPAYCGTQAGATPYYSVGVAGTALNGNTKCAVPNTPSPYIRELMSGQSLGSYPSRGVPITVDVY